LFLAKHELHGRLTTNPNYIACLTASDFLGCVAIVTHNPTLMSSSHLGTWQFLKQRWMKKEKKPPAGTLRRHLSTALWPLATAKENASESKTPLGTLLEKLGSRVKEDSQDVFLLRLLETHGSDLSSRHSSIVMNTLKQFGVEAEEDLNLLTPARPREHVEKQNFPPFQRVISPMQVAITETFLRDQLGLASFLRPMEATSSASFVQSEGPCQRVASTKRRASRGDSLTRNDRASIGSLVSTASAARPSDRSSRRAHSDRRSNVLQPSDFSSGTF
jgi:hypothetical protein